MSFPCKFSVSQEMSDAFQQKKKELQIEYEPEVKYVTIKKERTTDDHVEHYNGDDNSELQSETKESSISTQCVKQECFTKDLEEIKQKFIPCESVKVEHILQCSAENLVDNEHDPFAINDIKIERVKNDYTFTETMKEDLATEIKEQKYDDVKYNIDVVEHKVGCSVDNNLTSFKSISDDRVPSTSRQNALESGKHEQDPSLLEDKQNIRKHKHITSLEVNKKGNNNAECSECHKMFTSVGNLKRHVNVIHKGIKMFECNICQNFFSHRGELRRHINTVHKGYRGFECSECHKVFSTAARRKLHIDAIHKGIKNFQCHECHKMFSQSSSLKSHNKIVHMGIKIFECNECSKRFSRLAKLKRHINGVHLKIRNSKCNVCNKMLLCKTSVEEHVNRVHKGKVVLKKYNCNYCHKIFSGATNRKTHIDSIHRGIKNFKCNMCSKMFPQACHLKQHLDIHKGIRFECYICYKKFSRKYSLKMHINTVHKGIKIFECYDCNKYFSRLYVLRTHIYSEHKRNKNY